ncbi:unnamed protein product [Pieris brassicae]|uniref:Uncharacterized protein n=1 Tax=Pieris brassicae TaxID=7116 RepID=A0A9P0TU97_PIEBR|nr:unnamed protein product [Pieris brassicae]
MVYLDLPPYIMLPYSVSSILVPIPLFLSMLKNQVNQQQIRTHGVLAESRRQTTKHQSEVTLCTWRLDRAGATIARAFETLCLVT